MGILVYFLGPVIFIVSEGAVSGISGECRFGPVRGATGSVVGRDWSWTPETNCPTNWQLALDVLPLVSWSYKAGLADMLDFSRCYGRIEETTTHAFYHRERVRPFWDYIGEVTIHINSKQLELLDVGYIMGNFDPSWTDVKLWEKIMPLTYRTCVWLKKKNKKAKMATHSRFCTCLVSLRVTHVNDIVGFYKRELEETEIVWNGRHVACLCNLVKFFKLQAISAGYYFLAMEGKIFDVRLIPEFSGAATDMPIVEWVENVELVCELFAMKNVECVLPLRLQGGAFAVYRQLSAEQKADAEQIKQALITAYAADAFNAYDQFVTRNLRPGETVDEFFCWAPTTSPVGGGDRCPNVGWRVHSSLDYPNTLNIFYVPHPGWKRWVRNSYWPERELSWLTTKALQNWPPPPPVEHLQSQKCAVTIENLPATGVVVPTSWRRTAWRIAKRNRTVGCARFVARRVATGAVALDM